MPAIEAFAQRASDKHSAEPKQEQEQEQSSQAWPAPTAVMRSVRVSSVRSPEDASQLLQMA